MRLILLITALALLAAALPATAQVPPDLPMVCVLLIDIPDAGYGLCVDADGPCLVAEYRTYIWGSEVTCRMEHPL